MIVYHAREFEGGEPRAHPWSRSVSDESHVYVDFKERPDLIAETLEDFRPFKNQEFTQKFFELLEWLNGPKSRFESNDCAFVGACENGDSRFPYAMSCSGRLMIMFRDIEENCQPKSIGWLMDTLKSVISGVNPNFRAGAIGLSRTKAIYKALGNSPTSGAMGEQLMLSFFAYGKDEQRCYQSMQRLIECVHGSIKRVSRKVEAGDVDALYR